MILGSCDGADEGEEIGFVRLRIAAPGHKGAALIGAQLPGRIGQDLEAVALGRHVLRRAHDGRHRLAIAHGLEALVGVADRHRAIVLAELQMPPVLEDLVEHDAIARLQRINRDGLALDVRIGLDLGAHHEAVHAAVDALEGEHVEGAGQRNVALPLAIGDDIVESRADDVVFAGIEVAHLIDRAGGGGEGEVDALLCEVALLLRHPDRQIGRATEAQQANVGGLRAAGCNERQRSGAKHA